jgi:hypothetical protein
MRTLFHLSRSAESTSQVNPNLASSMIPTTGAQSLNSTAFSIPNAAAALGRIGGKSKSAAKRRASANNGKLGGRPKLQQVACVDVDPAAEIRAAKKHFGPQTAARPPRPR